MYLKSIEIQGFKSFANKTVFEFHNGITCIVGPNGSGKSNVADAVRWVLGEQSAKQLRGSNMQDVIFSGTQLRKPQGFASVAITFENEDHTLNVEYDEVTVTRRVYRSGESEYLLNGAACRLRDINELFFDTGIGKEGYSIIGQGQIDKILSSKPDDRRELFDEAAGIVKFKYRKAVAQKRLESEQANMVRLSDIMAELDRQVGPLEHQAKTAREYLRLRDELKGFEVNAFVLESRETEKTLEELEKKLKITSDDYCETETAAKELKRQYADQQAGLEEAERQIQESREKMTDCRTQSQEKDGCVRVLQEQIRAQQLRKEQTDSRLGVLKTEREELDREKNELDTRKQELNRRIYDAAAQNDRTKQEMSDIETEMSRLRKCIQEDQKKVIRLLNQKSELMTESQKYQTMLEQYRIQKAQFDQKLLLSKEEEGRCQERLERQKEIHRAAEKGLQSAGELAARKESGSRRMQMRQQELQNRCMELRRVYQVTAAKTESLRNLAERYEGYGNSVRRIMELKDRCPGICGAVADLIHVEKRYETAIETALGGSIQNIVTDTQQTAKELISYLKRNKLGRATFLPLDAVEDREGFRQKDALREPGVIGTAQSLVETERRFSGVIGFLLGRVLVVDDIDHGLRVAAKYHRSFRIVTLEGDLLNIGGSMTGGAYKNSSNLLGRARELEELEESLRVQKEKLDAAEQESSRAAEDVKTAEEELSQARAMVQEKALAETEARMDCQAAQQRVKEIFDEREQTMLELRLLERSIQEARDRKQAVLSRVKELEREGNETQNEAEAFRETAESSEAKKEELSKELRRQDLEIAGLAQSDSFLQENLRRIMGSREKNVQETEALQRDLASFREIVEKKEQEIAETEEAAENLREQASALADAIRSLTEQKEKTNESLRQFFERQEELSSRMNMLDKEILRMGSQKERCEETLDSQTDYLWTEYEIRPSEAKSMFSEIPGGLAEAKKRISDLKSRIKALGNVNVNAIEEYRELMERWTFMKGQYDDLVVSRDSLLGVIDELDRGMRLQFEEKFAQIKEEFDKVFKELFGGGTGTVELVEGEDVLEAGITIVSQPPGKKLQNMMQLSGGEKALTAIALLFAIQNLKPSPFCLLDEIEAALDDSNVGRFAGYLHKLTKNTQFIVITHRRGTMAAADRLYGITMQEKGVSALVSVSLIEQQLDK